MFKRKNSTVSKIAILKFNHIIHTSFFTVCHEPTGRCFWLGAEASDWNSARTVCQSEGGELAVMETQELWDFVRNNSVALGYKLFFLEDNYSIISSQEF